MSIFSLLFFVSSLPIGTVSVTSEQWRELDYNTTGKWQYHRGTWFIVSSDRSAGSVSIWKWERDGDIGLLLESGPREGISSVSAATMVPGTGRMVMRCLSSGRIFEVDTSAPEPSFKRIHHATFLSGGMIAWDEETLIGANASLELEQISGEKPLTFFPEVRKLLPDDTEHPSMRSISTHQMRMTRLGNRLIIGYTFYPKYIDFDLTDKPQRKIKNFRFPGYSKPPKKYIEPFSMKAHREWTQKYHHLRSFSWYGEAPYARLKKGFSNFGVWVDLENPEAFTWDNQVHEDMIFAIGHDELVMARVNEDDQGLVTCSLWRISSLPSHR